MPRPSPPPERSFPARAQAKRLAAERREIAAVRLREEAEELDRRWREFCAKQNAKSSAKQNVKAKAKASA